ncbi:gluconokinase [Agromyces rhizosphaerae]|uniref:Gluconokinase n=1 Tax=Agromyces rhizosphaerae TaxID=88374 RepID=A0A9W6CWW2_9MICO|nr:gluconokinase [Agromyces rhizosphaerae]GLI27820.1 gluconokinase [Agromyces rhizosphaerae]
MSTRAEVTTLPPTVVMGVSAAGKSSVGRAIAARSGAAFADGDDLHPAANVAKMARGEPLDDADRAPWLDEVGATLARHGDDGIVVACSALKRAYRDRIRRAAPATRFVFLSGTPELLAERAGARTGHFMPPALLASQLAALEPLAPDEAGVTLDIADPVDALAADAVAALRESR